MVPNEGELELLTQALSSGEDWILALHKTADAPTNADTVASYSLVSSSDWPGYSHQTLTRTISGSTWQTPALVTPTNGWSGQALVAESTYGTAPITYTNNGAGTVTVYGYILYGATSNKVYVSELFPVSRSLAVNDQLQVTPRFGGS